MLYYNQDREMKGEIKMVKYYAKCLVNEVLGEYKTSRGFDTEEEARQELRRMCMEYNSHGGYVKVLPAM